MIVNKKIAIAVISLLVLSLFSGFAAGKRAIDDSNGNGKNNDDLAIQTASPIIVASQPVGDKSREFSLGKLSSCQDVGLRRGDTASFSSDGYEYVIRPGFVGNSYIQLSLNPGSFSDRIYVMSDKLYDLDVDGRYELEISLTDILNGKAYLSVCRLENAQPAEDNVLKLEAPEGLIAGQTVKQQSNGKLAFSWITGLVLAIAGIVAFVFWKRH